MRQVLVEHAHFNNEVNRAHILSLLERASKQDAVPIVNYNDAVAVEELRKMEISALDKAGKQHVELVDNDETAAQIACLTGAKTLLILTKLDGIFLDINDPSSLITEITGTKEEVLAKIEEYQKRTAAAPAARARTERLPNSNTSNRACARVSKSSSAAPITIYATCSAARVRGRT